MDLIAADVLTPTIGGTENEKGDQEINLNRPTRCFLAHPGLRDNDTMTALTRPNGETRQVLGEFLKHNEFEQRDHS